MFSYVHVLFPFLMNSVNSLLAGWSEPPLVALPAPVSSSSRLVGSFQPRLLPPITWLHPRQTQLHFIKFKSLASCTLLQSNKCKLFQYSQQTGNAHLVPARRRELQWSGRVHCRQSRRTARKKTQWQQHPKAKIRMRREPGEEKKWKTPMNQKGAQFKGSCWLP